MLYNSKDDVSNNLIELLNSFVTSRLAGISLINQFYRNYHVNLIFQITEISTSILEQKKYLKKFIEFDIIQKDYPYSFKEESLKELEPIRKNMVSKS